MMTVTDEMIEAAALSDAEFDGRNFVAMGRVERERYMLRAKASIISALSAALSHADHGGVKVKALEWDRGEKPGIHYADTRIGTYFAYADGTLALNDVQLSFVRGRTWPDTEAAAQADYEARILSALTQAPAHTLTGEVETPAPVTHVDATIRDGISAALVAMKLAAALPGVAKEYDFTDAIAATEAAWLAVRDAAPAPANHVAWGDWTVDDTDTARQILNYLGIGDDASREPGADRRRDKIAGMIRARIDAVPAPAEHTPCPCTLIEQAEDCPVGYPSMICGVCKGTGNTTPEQVTALACEMLKIASDIGGPEDPFAAWESIDLLKSHIKQLRKALEPFALMSAEGVVSQVTNYSTVKTVSDYFHSAARVLATTEGSDNG